MTQDAEPTLTAEMKQDADPADGALVGQDHDDAARDEQRGHTDADEDALKSKTDEAILKLEADKERNEVIEAKTLKDSIEVNTEKVEKAKSKETMSKDRKETINEEKDIEREDVPSDDDDLDELDSKGKLGAVGLLLPKPRKKPESMVKPHAAEGKEAKPPVIVVDQGATPKITHQPETENGIILSWLSPFDSIDKHFSGVIHRLEWGRLFESLMLVPTFAYSVYGIVLFCVAYTLWLRSLLHIANLLCVLVVNTVSKRIVQRPRPLHSEVAQRMFDLDGVFLVKHSFSMPSGDTAQATAFALTVLFSVDLEATPAWWSFLLTVPLAGFGRCYFGKHYIGDTLCGTIEATVICCAVHATIGPHLFW